jgi:hypothetical protein
MQKWMDLRKKMVATQTGEKKKKKTAKIEREYFELFAMLSKTKCIHFRWSLRYKDYIVELTFSNQKQYILNRSEWQKFTNYFNIINHVFREKRVGD